MPTKVLSHFKKNDPALHAAIRSLGDDFTAGPHEDKDLFASLCRIVVGQQLSGKAAQALWKKFTALFPNKKPTAKKVLEMSEAQLRSSGISYSKVHSIQDLSQRIAERSLRLSALRSADEDTAREQLLAVRGIGPWSCDMFLMFSLGKEDVFAPGDLGLRKSIKNIYGHKKLPDIETVETLAEKWSPYRTYAACALWRVLDNQ